MTNEIFSPIIVPFSINSTHLFPPNSSFSWSCSTRMQPNMFQTQTMQCVITSYSAIHQLAGLMCGPTLLDVDERQGSLIEPRAKEVHCVLLNHRPTVLSQLCIRELDVSSSIAQFQLPNSLTVSHNLPVPLLSQTCKAMCTGLNI